MSDSVRVYSGQKKNLGKPRRRRSRKGLVLLMLLLIGAAWVYWTTRDTHRLESLIPADKAYHAVVDDVFARRARLAQSQVWDALPPQLGLADVPQKLSQDVGLPQWVLNNLVPGACYITGDDIKGFGDALAVTRMTRVGVLLDRLRVFFPSIKEDYAGGLELRRVGDLYYAVRGRVLLLSASRRRLVEALTLLAEDAVGADDLAQMRQSLGENDIYGRFQLAETDPGGAVVERGTFALRIGGKEAAVQCAAQVRPAWREEMAGLLDGVEPKTLEAPPDGMVRLSLNLGRPVEALWQSAGTALGKEEQMREMWAQWASPDEDGDTTVPQMVLGLLGGLGPGVRLSLVGVDLNEIVPAPELVATLDADSVALAEVFAQLPEPPSGVEQWETWPRYDKEAQVVRLPLIGGPSLEPTGGIKGGNFVMSSSRTVAESVLADAATANPPSLPKPANFYAQIRPYECGKAAFDTAMLLAEAKLLKGYNPETLNEAYQPWLKKAAAVKQLSALAAYDAGALTLECQMECAAK